MNIRTPTSPGVEPLRFLAAEEATNSLTGRPEVAGFGVDRARIGAVDSPANLDGEAILAMDAWDMADSRALQSSVPASLAVPIGGDIGESVERAVDFVLSPLS